MSDRRESLKRTVLNEFAEKTVLVIGDIMVDEYITGKVKRISPEAPVPVLNYRERSLEAGGASNVAHNIHSLGAKVYIAGTVAKDDAGMWLREHFEKLGIDTHCLIAESNRPTTIKTRYATKGQQLLRVDNEITSNITEDTQNAILDFLESNVASIDAVVLSDYKKGVLGDECFVEKLIEICNENNVLISIDSKSRNIVAFKNASFVKPNNHELEEAVGIHIEDEESLNAAGMKYLSESEAEALIVTRGKDGISVFLPDKDRQDFPAKDVPIFDVCGAGDTVISTISMGMISGLSIEESVRLANLAAGVVITKVGTVAITTDELVRSIDEE